MPLACGPEMKVSIRGTDVVFPGLQAKQPRLVVTDAFLEGLELVRRDHDRRFPSRKWFHHFVNAEQRIRRPGVAWMTQAR